MTIMQKRQINYKKNKLKKEIKENNLLFLKKKKK